MYRSHVDTSCNSCLYVHAWMVAHCSSTDTGGTTAMQKWSMWNSRDRDGQKSWKHGMFLMKIQQCVHILCSHNTCIYSIQTLTWHSHTPDMYKRCQGSHYRVVKWCSTALKKPVYIWCGFQNHSLSLTFNHSVTLGFLSSDLPGCVMHNHFFIYCKSGNFC